MEQITFKQLYEIEDALTGKSSLGMIEHQLEFANSNELEPVKFVQFILEHYETVADYEADIITELVKQQVEHIKPVKYLIVNGVNIEERIKELEAELQYKLETTPDVRTGPKSTTHSVLRQKYHRRISSLRKFGVESCLSKKSNIRKRLKTMEDKYDGKHCNIEKTMATKQAKGLPKAWNNAKAIERKREKYGKKLEKIVEKMQDTCFERHGDRHYNNAEQTTKTKLGRYGHRYKRYSEFRDALRAKCLAEYGVETYCLTPQCQQAVKNYRKSETNDLWREQIKKFTGIELENEVYVGRKPFDLGNDKLLIDINPAITHNSTWSFENLKRHLSIPYEQDWHRPKESHQEKLLLGMSSGKRTIMIWPWDDEYKTLHHIKNILLIDNSIIYARECTIKEIDKKTAANFLDEHHLQGNVNGQQYCIALYYNNELVMLMTFGKPRYNKNYEYELLRLCATKHIVGGAERLLSYFVAKVCPMSIISYCDISKFEGKVYERLGFTQQSLAISKHWYHRFEDKHFTDNYLRMHGADRLLGTSYGKGTSNEEIMLKHGYVEIYDCGQATYVWHSNNQQQ